MDAEQPEETLPVKVEAWEQLPAEPKEAFLRFQAYLNLGYKRTLRKLYLQECRLAKEDPKATPQSLVKLSILWEWTRRVTAYDESVIAEDSRQLAIRRAEIREDEFGMAKMLMSKAKQMLELPLVTRTVQDGDGNTVIINPARWTLSDVPSIVKAASDLARLSLDMSQGKMEVSVSQDQRSPMDDMIWLKEIAARGTEIPGVTYTVEDRPDADDTHAGSENAAGSTGEAVSSGDSTDHSPETGVRKEPRTPDNPPSKG